MFNRSLRIRLTVWYSATVLIVLSTVAVYVLWQQQRIGLQRVDDELNDLQVTLASVAREEFEEKAPEAERESLSMVNPPGKALAIFDERGHAIAATWNGLHLDEPLTDVTDGPRVWSTRPPQPPWRVHTFPDVFDQRRLVLLVASPLTDVDREQRVARQAMAVAVPLALLLAAAGGLWIASAGLRPLTEMAAQASQMPISGAGHLGTADRTDELGQLARAFNGLVARLRAALDTQRRFMADASHELRTPVSVMRSAAEVTLSREHRDESEYREALAIVDGQTRRLGRLVDDMLVLARADASGYPLRFETIYAEDLVADVSRMADPIAAENRVNLTVSGSTDLELQGDVELLTRMLLNVVQNAVQHAPAGSAVHVTIRSQPQAVEFSVANEGTTIAAADRERIFERFVQLDPSRRNSGSGLGLPIARWIAEAHKGALRLAPDEGRGTVFVVTLPQAAVTLPPQ